MIVSAETDAQILATCPVMRQLRPHLPTGPAYVAVIRALMESDGYRLASIVEEGEVRAVAGYRLITMLYCGRILSIDDLVTDAGARSRGFGSKLLRWLKDEGRAGGCAELQLISRVTREEAHRFYFREGLGVEYFHFRTVLS